MSADLGLRLFEAPDVVVTTEVADNNHGHPSTARRIWAATWPKLVAVAIVLAIWQGIYAAHWRPDYVLPSPGDT